MTDLQAPMTVAPQAASLRFSVFSRLVVRRWIVYFIIGGGYLARILSTGHLTLLGFLLLTVTYGAWLVVFYLWGRRGEPRPLWGLLVLSCLACVSQFLSLSNVDLSWLPILPTATACLVIANSPRYLGLIVSGVLWLSSSLAFILNMHVWELGSQLILLLSFGSFVGLSVTIRELLLAHTALERSTAELALAHAQLQKYSAQVEEIGTIRERNRIAREIHDTLGHSLTLLAVQLETATQFEARGDPGLHEELLEARRVAKDCLADVRHSVEALRPDDAASNSLQERLRLLAAEYATTCPETAITLDLEEATHRLTPDVSQALYRCAQEALTNIRKHAHATKTLLYLGTRDGPEDGEQVELSVLDNGQGASAGNAPAANEQRVRGFGLLGMRERVALLNGTLRAVREPGHGWRVVVVIPLKQRETDGMSAPAPCEAGNE